MRATLETRHHAVCLAEDGGSALAIAMNERPDLVLLDWMLPDMSGLAVCRGMRANPNTAHIPIIFLTAIDELDHKIAGLEAGADDYMTKPFEPEELLARVNVQLRKAAEHNQVNPLSQLPGNIVIEKVIEERLATPDEIFALLYFDLNDFKAYNDFFGFSWGVVWNWSGIVLGSVVGYGLARLLGREFIERIGGSKVRRAEKQFQRRGFLPLVAARFVPIPFAIVNAAAAVVGVRFGRFLLSTAIGMLPPITIFTYFSTALLEAATGERAVIARHLVYASVSAAFVVFVPLEVRRRLRKRRLARLRFHRAGRPSRS